MVLVNAVVAGSLAGGDLAQTGLFTTIDPPGPNIVGDDTLTGPGVLNVDPLLGPMAANGGPTMTHAPLPGSPAVDAADLALLAPTATDQRGTGFSRVRGAGLDLGAVETQPPPGPVSVAAVTPLAREGDPAANALVFAVRRSGTSTDPLDIPAAFAGSATPDDYVVTVAGGVQTPTGFRFAAGVDELTVTLTIVDDPNAETVVLSVGQGLGIPADAGVALVDRDLDTRVTSAADDGSGSLRLALRNAEERPGADVVTFDPVVFSTPRTITLSSGVLTVRTAVTIAGSGAVLLTIRGAGGGTEFNGGVVRINDGSSTLQTVRIEGLTITGGHALAGGGISNRESLELVRSVVTGNTTPVAFFTGRGGGGIYNAGTLALTDSTISGNTSRLDGGGGGIYNRGTLTVVNSTVSGNTTTQGSGGGIANGGLYVYSPSSTTLVRSTVSGNTAGRNGGGIFNGRGSYYYDYNPSH